ncbi:hypothetical protein [Pectobacterium carotovorum]|uniref:hypothetical protein n=1 Tax=Pectobacterium carotovorum TaxID=554 RepID=UPI00031F7B3A|nr:hypothetical protein [Pectobacterium carotovorum]
MTIAVSEACRLRRLSFTKIVVYEDYSNAAANKKDTVAAKAGEKRRKRTLPPEFSATTWSGQRIAVISA